MNDSDQLESNHTPIASTSPSEDQSSIASTSNINDNTRSRSQTNSDPTQEVTMLATQYPSAIGGNIFSGHGQGKNPAAITMDLQTLRSSPILNPHFKMIQRYIDCLNWYIDVCVSSQGPAGIRTWMLEVQHFTLGVQKRAYQRMPLMMEERSAILQFTTYWRQQAHNPYLMGRPEVQVVLLALAETAQM